MGNGYTFKVKIDLEDDEIIRLFVDTFDSNQAGFINPYSRR